jgi:hypothetical protein
MGSVCLHADVHLVCGGQLTLILGCAGYHDFRSILLGVLTFHG